MMNARLFFSHIMTLDPGLCARVLCFAFSCFFYVARKRREQFR